MGEAKVPNFHARKLARELARLRRTAGLTQRDAFPSTRMKVQTVCRVESGQMPKFLELRALLDLYGVPVCDWDLYQDIWERAKVKAWWEGKHLRDVARISSEHEARMIRDVQLIRLPVLLQTEAYARRLLETAPLPLGDEQLKVELEARVRRGQVLDGDDPVQLHALIYQPVLQSGVDIEQLRHLRYRAAQSNVTLQIITHLDGPPGEIEGSFSLMSFPGNEEPDVAHIDYTLGTVQTEDATQTTELRTAFEKLTRRAMSPENSLTHLDNLLAQTPDEP